MNLPKLAPPFVHLERYLRDRHHSWRGEDAIHVADALAAGGGDLREPMVLSVRIGTAEDGAPVVASWPALLHRELPKGALITRAVVQRRMVGPRAAWTACLTLDVSAASPTEGKRQTPIVAAAKGAGAVAVSIGWSSIEHCVRVATWVGSGGEAGVLELSTVPALSRDGRHKAGGGILSGLERADTLRSTRDGNLSAALLRLVAELRAYGMPDWMRARTVRKDAALPTEKQALAYLSEWRSPARLAALWSAWADHRFAGDESMFDALGAWRYHDRHLWAWEAEQRKRSELARREAYRVLGATLARRYEALVVSDVDYRALRARPKTEDDPVAQAAQRAQTRAAPGELREILGQAFKRRGGPVTKILGAHARDDCPACGARGSADGARMMCLECIYEGDVHETSAKNLLRRAGNEDAVDAMIARSREVARNLRHGGHEDGQAAE